MCIFIYANLLDDYLMDAFFKVLADETRLRCLVLIFSNEELCVCELMYALALPQSKISRHLSIIRLNGLIKQRREGQWILYSANHGLSMFKQGIIEQCITECNNIQPFLTDQKRLLHMTNRPLIMRESGNV